MIPRSGGVSSGFNLPAQRASRRGSEGYGDSLHHTIAIHQVDAFPGDPQITFGAYQTMGQRTGKLALPLRVYRHLGDVVFYSSDFVTRIANRFHKKTAELKRVRQRWSWVPFKSNP